MSALLRNSADGEAETLLKLLEEQADIRHAIDHLVEQGPFDLRLLQGLNRLVEQAPLGRWHHEILEKARGRLDLASEAWLNAVLLLQRGKRATILGKLDEARQAFENSLEIRRRLHDERGEAMVLNSLGGVLRDLGRMDEARQAFENSLEIRRRLHDERGEAMVLSSLGGVLRDMGHLDEARQAFENSLETDRRLQDERGEAMILNSLGGVLRDMGRMDEARQAFENSLETDRRLHDERGEAMALNSLGGALRDLGRTDEALQAFENSLKIHRALEDQRGEAMALNSLGGALRDLGRMDEARWAFEGSLEIVRMLNDKRTEASVLNNLGWWFREQGDPVQALKALEEHTAIRNALGLPIVDFLKSELRKLRQWLKRLEDGTGRAADYHLDMAKKRIYAKDWPGAIIHMRYNLALNDSALDRGERLENLAYVYFRAERRAECIRISKESVTAGFENARLCANLGRALYLEGGCLEESQQFLRRSLDLNPDNPWAWSWLGLVLADQGSLEDAENHARRALVGHEQHAVLIQNLALVLVHHSDERADKLKEALNCCEQAEKFADFPFPHPAQLAISLRQRLQSLGTRQNPST